MKADQKKWADLVVSGIDYVEACLMVWENITKKTAHNKAGILKKNKGIQEYIEKQRQKVNEKVANLTAQSISDNEVKNILSATKKREILFKIISGKYEIEQVGEDGKVKKVKVKPTLSDILKAIDLDNRMSGDLVLAKPNQVAKAQEVKEIIVVEDGSNPIEQNPNTGNNQEA